MITIHELVTLLNTSDPDKDVFVAVFKTDLTQNTQALDAAPTRVPHPEVTNPTTMKHRILRVATALGIPVTVRKVPGGLLFWRSTGEDLQQAPDVANRLQGRRQQQTARPHGAHAESRVKER